MTERVAIILAAGMGTRMKSSLPKVLHQVGNRSMLEWAIECARGAGCQRTVVVIGTHSEDLRHKATALVGAENVAVQDPPLGTGHAVLAARDALEGFEGDAVVLFADTPLIPSETVAEAFAQTTAGAAVTVLGFQPEDAGSYGRLIRDDSGALVRIVEAKDASPEELAVPLCNSGVMAVNAPLLFDLLSEVGNDNAKGEYYLTDIVGIAVARGMRNAVVECGEDDVMGVNSRVHLAEAEAVFQARTRQAMLEKGVTLQSPDTTFFSFDTNIENDVVVEPNVVFGPGVRVATGTVIRAFSHLEGCTVGQDCQIGPFARLRPASELGTGVKIGNFVETKKTRMGDGSKANHLAYLGDGDIGAGANIGAGTIFCNYDGYFKHTTTIKDGAFVGSNSALVAPVTIGENAYVGSGSVVTSDVPSGALGVARGRQKNLDGWADKFHEETAARKAATKKG